MSLSNIFQGTNKAEADLFVDNINSAGGITVGSGANITMAGGKVTGLGTPTLASDGATKQYVDTAVATGGGSFLPLSGGSMTGGISMGSNGLTNLPAPIASADATPKTYVDSSVASAIASAVNVNGTSVMTGSLNVGNQKVINLATPTNATDATTKQYVDTAVATGGGAYLPLAGGTMTGVINMGSQKITGLAVPTQPTDATTKTYVDTAVATGGGAYLPLGGGTLTGNLIVGNNKTLSVSGTSYLNGGATMGGATLTGLATPVQPTDATTKQYVDTAVATGGGAYVPLAGGNMTGTLSITPSTAVPSIVLNPAVGSSPAFATINYSSGVDLGLIQMSNSQGELQIDIGGTGGYQSIMTGQNGGELAVDCSLVELNCKQLIVSGNGGVPPEVALCLDYPIQGLGNPITFLGGRINYGFGELRPAVDIPPYEGLPFIQIRDRYYGDGTYLNLWYCRQSNGDPTSGGLAIKSSGSSTFAIINKNGVSTHPY